MGDRSGLGVLSIGQLVDPEEAAFVTGRRCAMIDGVSLHANVAVPRGDRRRLEKLCRYIARPPVSTERLSQLPDGRLLYRLKRKWRDGTTHVVFEPLELLEKLAAIVPPPRIHMVRYHGVGDAHAASLRRRRPRVSTERRQDDDPRDNSPTGGDHRDPRVARPFAACIPARAIGCTLQPPLGPLSESCSERRPTPLADQFDYIVVIARPAHYGSRGGDGGKPSK